MVIGFCKLCLNTKPLQRSHLIPAAMYKYVLDPTNKNDRPVVVGRKITGTTSKQVRNYLLCASCEDRFNKNGERTVLKQVWNGKSFPLLDRLNVAHPYYFFSHALVFSGSAVGIDTDSLGYFALSVLWRAGARVWDLAFGGKSTLLDLGALAEPIRRYLLGELPFPEDIVVMVHVCTDEASRHILQMPSIVRGHPVPSFSFHTVGILCRIYVGPTIPKNFKLFCCVKSTKKLIFQADCAQKTIRSFGELMKTSRAARGMKG